MSHFTNKGLSPRDLNWLFLEPCLDFEGSIPGWPTICKGAFKGNSSPAPPQFTET